jgi:hypothetical protein
VSGGGLLAGGGYAPAGQVRRIPLPGLGPVRPRPSPSSARAVITGPAASIVGPSGPHFAHAKDIGCTSCALSIAVGPNGLARCRPCRRFDLGPITLPFGSVSLRHVGPGLCYPGNTVDEFPNDVCVAGVTVDFRTHVHEDAVKGDLTAVRGPPGHMADGVKR